jgi:hypothetical protein
MTRADQGDADDVTPFLVRRRNEAGDRSGYSRAYYPGIFPLALRMPALCSNDPLQIIWAICLEGTGRAHVFERPPTAKGMVDRHVA